MKNINCKCPCSLKELLFFNKLIMPSVLTVIYWIVLFFAIVGGLISMFTGGIWGFFIGLIGMAVAVVSIRIFFELICVVFSINRNLEKLVALQSGQEITPDEVFVKTEEKEVIETEAKADVSDSVDSEGSKD